MTKIHGISRETQLDTIRAMYLQENAYKLNEGVSFTERGLSSRRKMLLFFYELASRIETSRETVEVAMSYLDRFLASEAGSSAFKDKRMFQLAATTCLYVSQKAHESVAITPVLLSELSRGAFSARDVEEMELNIAKTLQWRLHPPTAVSFVRQYLDLLPSMVITRDVSLAVSNLARSQTEFSIEDSRLMGERKSYIAYIALLNAVEHLSVKEVVLELQQVLEPALGIDSTTKSFASVQRRLKQVLTKQNGIIASYHMYPCRGASLSLDAVPPAPHSKSPRCISNNLS